MRYTCADCLSGQCIKMMLTLSPCLRHTHGACDCMFCNFTTKIFGVRNSPGLKGGIKTLEEWDDLVRTCYPKSSYRVSVTRMDGLLDIKGFLENSIGIKGFAPRAKKSEKAKAQGGRDHEGHFFRFKMEENRPTLRYKTEEAPDRDDLYLPPLDKPGIPVSWQQLSPQALHIADPRRRVHSGGDGCLPDEGGISAATRSASRLAREGTQSTPRRDLGQQMA